MKQVRLIGKTKHGKERIRQHGEVWIIKAEAPFNGRPTWSLQSIEKTFGGFKDGHREHDRRWVLKQDDPNFDWEFV